MFTNRSNCASVCIIYRCMQRKNLSRHIDRLKRLYIRPRTTYATLNGKVASAVHILEGCFLYLCRQKIHHLTKNDVVVRRWENQQKKGTLYNRIYSTSNVNFRRFSSQKKHQPFSAK